MMNNSNKTSQLYEQKTSEQKKGLAVRYNRLTNAHNYILSVLYYKNGVNQPEVVAANQTHAQEVNGNAVATAQAKINLKPISEELIEQSRNLVVENVGQNVTTTPSSEPDAYDVATQTKAIKAAQAGVDDAILMRNSTS